MTVTSTDDRNDTPFFLFSISHTVEGYGISILPFQHNIISFVGETVISQTSLLEKGQCFGSSSAIADLLFNISCCSANIRAHNN